jgi:hypothetical protein
MITELVLLQLRKGITRDEVMALYRQTAPAWAKNPDLLLKHYFFNEEQSVGGGVYVWTSKEAALRGHGEEYRTRVRELYGSEPRISHFDTLIVVDNVLKEVSEPPPSDK